MERKITPFTFLLSTLIALAVLLSSSIMLPHERYYRYQAHDSITTRQADWIYERLHFDPTPIDVALIGTSRMVGSLSSPQIERDYCRATGRRIHVANLAIPVTGRNMHYVIAKEVAAVRAPALFVIELNEVETRRPHVGFIFLADARDILSAPVMINLNYLSDLLRLPGRQANLFVQSVLGTPAVHKEFDPQSYAGDDRDLTQEIHFIDGRKKSRDITRTDRQMEAISAYREAGVSPLYLLPRILRPLEYRFSRHYLRKTERVAANAAAKAAYVYLPAYGAAAPTPGLVEELKIEETILDLGGDITADPAQWLDATHVNARGAKAQSARFAAALAASYPLIGEPGGCPLQ